MKKRYSDTSDRYERLKDDNRDLTQRFRALSQEHDKVRAADAPGGAQARMHGPGWAVYVHGVDATLINDTVHRNYTSRVMGPKPISCICKLYAAAAVPAQQNGVHLPSLLGGQLIARCALLAAVRCRRKMRSSWAMTATSWAGRCASSHRGMGTCSSSWAPAACMPRAHAWEAARPGLHA